LWQLALTLPYNLENLKKNEEFILVNYGSTDNLTRYIESSYLCKELMDDNRFKYIDVLDVSKYNCPKAKNIAHRFACGNFLVNLDADNVNHLINEKIMNTDGRNKALIHLVSNNSSDGTYGKICVPKHVFYKLGGYDESLLPTAYQDTDLIERAKAMNVEIINKQILVHSVPNTMKEKVNQTGLKDWWECKYANQAKSELNISNNNLIANKDTGWGYAKVKINFGKTQEFKEIFPSVQ
jgi:glycosyltransferase involved in cell wall biosynthesis